MTVSINSSDKLPHRVYLLSYISDKNLVIDCLVVTDMQNSNNVLLEHRMQALAKMTAPSSSRILYDIPCKVCRDHSSGKHYGIFACDGCAGFFKRSIRRNRQYVCKAKEEGTCIIDKTHRNQCRACRLAKCQDAGMNKDAVQHERGPRNSTLRRQMALYFNKDPNEGVLSSSAGPVLDLAMPKAEVPSSHLEPSNSFIPQPPFMCNPLAAMARFPVGTPLPTTAFVPPTISTETICESAARLLFMNVKWAKNVPSFVSLPMADQLLLLEESWRELFVLGAAQFLVPLELAPLIHSSGALARHPDRAVTFFHEVKLFQETLSKFAQLQVDGHEFACLRAIVLFKTGFDMPGGSKTSPSSSSSDAKSVSDAAAVAALQDQTQLTLNKYIQTMQPGQPLRFGKLLLLLPALKTISNYTIEELFFRRTIGNIPIERIICDMYKASDI